MRRGLGGWVFGAVVVAIAAGPALSIENSECLECHREQSLTTTGPNGEELSLYVGAAAYEASVHGFLSCTDCHADITELMHESDLAPVDCGTCHSDAVEEYAISSHGVALARGNPDAPDCAGCHGVHDILSASDPQSNVSHFNLPGTCARCHADPDVVQRLPFSDRAPVQAYMKSVHGKALLVDGNAAAPSCDACHPAHNILPPTDPTSTVNKRNIPATCANCHGDIAEVYAPSIHGTELARGNFDSPSCSDCHGEHQIEAPEDPASTVFPETINKTTCPRCHASEILAQRYGFETARISSYEETYHGLASRRGDLSVANCASCHGVHNIYPSTDPRSTIFPANLTETCGDCHPNANERFAAISVHPGISEGPDGEARPEEVIRWIYVVLLVVIVGGMAVHNGIIWWHHVLEKIRRERGKRKVRRFTRFEATEHQLFLISFFMLVFTGFALRFPDASWVQLTEKLGMTEAVRSLLHRIFAVVMVAVSISHTIFLILTNKGRKEFLRVLPRATDIRDFVYNMAYHLGLRKERPRFPHFDYTEKVEYLALIWGTGVMVLTGLVLWFPTQATTWFPTWIFPVSEVIHYYEAWLAFLSIVVWHLFFVIFHPEVYPINLTFLRGEATEEHTLHKHGKVDPEDRV